MQRKKPKTQKPKNIKNLAEKEIKDVDQQISKKEEELDDFFEREMKEATWIKVFRNLLAGVVLFIIADLVFSLVAALISGTGILATLDFAVRFVPFFILSLIFVAAYMIFFVLISIFYHIIAKLLGGRGSFVAGTTLISYLFLGFAFSFLPVGLMMIFPALNCIMLPFGLLLVFYSFYVLYEITLVVHKVDKNRATIIVFALIVVLTIITLIVAAYTTLAAFNFLEPYVKDIVLSIGSQSK